MKKVVFTGGSYSGKTTILEFFRSKGFPTVPECARIVIEELNEKFGIEEQKKWRLDNFAFFQSMIAEKQAFFENKLDKELEDKSHEFVFLDRGVLDCIALCKLRNLEVPQKILDLAKKVKYDKVFVFDILSDFDTRPLSGRVLTKDLSIKLQELCIEVYKEYGCEPIFVEEMPTGDRIDFILSRIN